MLLEGIQVHQYIIDEYHHKLIKVWLENPIHQVHEAGWGIRQPEW
jgi:hypothetical protein